MDALRSCLPLVHQGKLRETCAVGDDLLIVASDRLAASGVVLPTVIPGRGAVLTGLSAFWFAQTGGLVPNHVLTTDARAMPLPGDVPIHAIAGRSMLVRRTRRIEVNCVVCGYLAGSGWEEYRAAGTLAGEPVAPGLRPGDRLPEPRFTPALTLDAGDDVPVSRQDLADQVGTAIADQLEQMSLNLYLAAAALTAERGLILADTSFAFGFIEDRLTLIDEALTLDSSRYWDRATWTPGQQPARFEKHHVHEFLHASGWNQQPPGPARPPEVVASTRRRYVEAYRRLTGLELAETGEAGPV